MLLSDILLEKANSSGDHQIFDALVPYVVGKLKDAGVKAENKYKKSASTVRHVRLDIPDPISVFKQLGITLKPLVGTKIATGSPTFTTYAATLDSKQDDFPEGSFFYVVNRFSAVGRVKGDMMTPTALAIEGEPSTPARIKHHVSTFLPSLDVFSGEELKYLNDMMSVGKSNTHKLIAPETITAHELNKIAVTFGEVVGALWYARKKPGQKIIFPSGNHPLVDFIIVSPDGSQESVSAKVGKGAPPSSAAIFAKIVEDRKYFEKKYGKKTVEVLESFDNLSVVDGVLEAHEILETPSYKALVKLGAPKDFNAKALEDWLQGPKFKTADDLRTKLEPFYKVNISRNEASAFDDIITTGARRVGLISTPLGYNLTKLLNNKSDYPQFTDILNDVTSRINVTQLYTNLTTEGIEFIIKPFSGGEFAWEFNATARDPYKKKMSFRMKK